MGKFHIGPANSTSSRLIQSKSLEPMFIEKIIEVEKIVEKEVPVYVERIVEKIVEVEKTIEVPIEKVIHTVVEKIVEVEKTVEVPVEKIVEVIKEVPKEVINYIDRIISKPYVPTWLFVALWVEAALLIALLAIKLL